MSIYQSVPRKSAFGSLKEIPVSGSALNSNDIKKNQSGGEKDFSLIGHINSPEMTTTQNLKKKRKKTEQEMRFAASSW